MQKTFTTAALLAAVCVAYATTPSAPTMPAVVSGSISSTVNSGTSASSYVSGVGTSSSTAFNRQSASGFITGSGQLGTTNTTQRVTLENCAPTSVSGKLTSGAVNSVGGVTAAGFSSASNVSTGTGVGAAAAAGSSFATAAGLTSVSTPQIIIGSWRNSYICCGERVPTTVYAIHRPWLQAQHQRRLERLENPNPAARLITSGCINVDAAVHDKLIECCTSDKIIITRGKS